MRRRSRVTVAVPCAVLLVMVAAGCDAEEARGSATPTQTVTVTVTAQPSQTPSDQPSEPTGVTVTGGVTVLELLTKDIAKRARCETRSVQVTIKDGAGQIVAMPTLNDVKPTRVEDKPSYISWSCEHTYSATLPLDSPAYTFRAYLDGLEDEYGDDERTVSGEKLSGGKGPYLSLTFAPGL